MEYRNELLDGWVGKLVVVMHLVGPEPNEEHLRAWEEDITRVLNRQSVTSRTAYYQLVSYDRLGLTLEALEDAVRFFVPWGAVLQLIPASAEETPDG
jgi:hypothetical protein